MAASFGRAALAAAVPAPGPAERCVVLPTQALTIYLASIMLRWHSSRAEVKQVPEQRPPLRLTLARAYPHVCLNPTTSAGKWYKRGSAFTNKCIQTLEVLSKSAIPSRLRTGGHTVAWFTPVSLLLLYG